jgi:hypothetical protein
MVSLRNTVLAGPKGPPETVLMAIGERRKVEFAVEGGVTLRGWLFGPDTKGRNSIKRVQHHCLVPRKSKLNRRPAQ